MKLIDADKLIENIEFMKEANCEGIKVSKALYKMLDTIFDFIMDHIKNMDEEHRWIPVEEGLPEEHNSVFAKLYGTDKWEESMFKKASSTVIVSVEVAGKTRYTTTASTRDGKWHNNFWGMFKKAKVIAWMHLPEPYAYKNEVETNNE